MLNNKERIAKPRSSTENFHQIPCLVNFFLDTKLVGIIVYCVKKHFLYYTFPFLFFPFLGFISLMATVVGRDEHRIYGIHRNIWALALTSFVNDIASEMILTLLPLYLHHNLKSPVVVIGIIEGVALAVTAFLKIFSGYLSDKIGHRKYITAAGYGLSAFARPFLALASGWSIAAAVRWLDRIGKGLRGAPRDAMIADSVPESQRGISYGLHRAAETLGAVISLLIAVRIVTRQEGGDENLNQDSYRTIIFLSIPFGILSVLSMLILAVDQPVGGVTVVSQLPTRRNSLAVDVGDEELHNDTMMASREDRPLLGFSSSDSTGYGSRSDSKSFKYTSPSNNFNTFSPFSPSYPQYENEVGYANVNVDDKNRPQPLYLDRNEVASRVVNISGFDAVSPSVTSTTSTTSTQSSMYADVLGSNGELLTISKSHKTPLHTEVVLLDEDSEENDTEGDTENEGEMDIDKTPRGSDYPILQEKNVISDMLLSPVNEEGDDSGKTKRKLSTSAETESGDQPKGIFAQLGTVYFSLVFIFFLFQIGNPSEAFLVLLAKSQGFDISEVLLLMLLYNLTYSSVSVPMGWFSDLVQKKREHGRAYVILTGWVLRSFVLSLMAAASSTFHFCVLFCLYGAYMGTVEGVLKALIVDVVGGRKKDKGKKTHHSGHAHGHGHGNGHGHHGGHKHGASKVRGLSFGLFQGFMGVADVLSGVIFGVLWDAYGPATSFFFASTVGLVCSLLLFVWRALVVPVVEPKFEARPILVEHSRSCKQYGKQGGKLEEECRQGHCKAIRALRMKRKGWSWVWQNKWNAQRHNYSNLYEHATPQQAMLLNEIAMQKGRRRRRHERMNGERNLRSP